MGWMAESICLLAWLIGWLAGCLVGGFAGLWVRCVFSVFVLFWFFFFLCRLLFVFLVCYVAGLLESCFSQVTKGTLAKLVENLWRGSTAWALLVSGAVGFGARAPGARAGGAFGAFGARGGG